MNGALTISIQENILSGLDYESDKSKRKKTRKRSVRCSDETPQWRTTIFR